MSGASPVTVNVSLTPATESLKSTVSVALTSRLTLSRADAWKPGRSLFTSYAPGSRPGSAHWPFSLVTVVRTTPVALFVTVMVTPGRTASLLSTTRPLNVLLPCANADVATSAMKAATSHPRMPSLLVMNAPGSTCNVRRMSRILEDGVRGVDRVDPGYYPPASIRTRLLPPAIRLPSQQASPDESVCRSPGLTSSLRLPRTARTRADAVGSDQLRRVSAVVRAHRCDVLR